MGKPLYLVDVLNRELGLSLDLTPRTISSPFRRDSNPSFRIYGIDSDGSDLGAYDWGTAKSYSAYSFIMEYKGLTFRDALKYLSESYSDYNISYTPHSGVSSGLFSVFKHSTPITTLSEAFLLEKALISSFNYKSNYLLAKYFIPKWVSNNSKIRFKFL